MAKYKEHDVLLVRWEDHCHSSGWQREVTLTPMYCLSVGLFIKEDDGRLILAQNLALDDGQPGNTMQIIKGDISEIRVLSRAKKSRN